MALVLVVAAVAAPAHAPVTISWDASRLSGADYDRVDALNLERRVLVRLIEDGYAVVRPPTTAAITVVLSVEADSLVIEAIGPTSHERAVMPIEGAPSWSLHLEVAHRVSELVHIAVAALPPPSPPPTRVIVQAPEPRETWGVRLGGGVIFRQSRHDGLARVGASWALSPQLRLHLQGAGMFSSGENLDVAEWQVLAGAAYRMDLGARLYLDVGIMGGVVLRHFSERIDVTEPASQSHLTYAFQAPLSLGVRIAGPLSVELRVAPGLMRAAQLATPAVVWRREAFSLETTGMLVFAPD